MSHNFDAEPNNVVIIVIPSANPVLAAIDESRPSKPQAERSHWKAVQLPLLPNEQANSAPRQPEQTKMEPVVLESAAHAQIIQEVAAAAQLPSLPHHWVELVESKPPTQVRLALEAVAEYSRRKQVRNFPAIVWKAIESDWKPNKRKRQS